MHCQIASHHALLDQSHTFIEREAVIFVSLFSRNANAALEKQDGFAECLTGALVVLLGQAKGLASVVEHNAVTRERIFLPEVAQFYGVDALAARILRQVAIDPAKVFVSPNAGDDALGHSTEAEEEIVDKVARPTLTIMVSIGVNVVHKGAEFIETLGGNVAKCAGDGRHVGRKEWRYHGEREVRETCGIHVDRETKSNY